MIRTEICDLFDIPVPVIQGGMAWVATTELVSAVSEAGGLGIIGAGNAPPEWVQDQIRETKKRTSRPFGVNIMLMSPFAREIIDLVIEERVAVVATGAGNPGVHMARFKAAGIKVMPVVSSVALAKRMERSGADAIVAEGMESGGHIGETTTMALVPQVVDAVKIPVVAAGGIADGRGLVASLALGAKGVQIGTRFVCSSECVAHERYKRKLVEARDRATITTGHTLGHPVRALENRMTREFGEMERKGLPREEIEAFGLGKLRQGLIEGDVEGGSLMAGQICGLIKEVKSVKEIIDEIMGEAEALLGNLAALRG